MNARTLVLVGAIVLVGLGLLMTLGDLFSPPPAAATTSPGTSTIGGWSSIPGCSLTQVTRSSYVDPSLMVTMTAAASRAAV